MMHKKLIAILSASVLCTAMTFASATVVAQDINYNLPTADEIQARKDARQNKAVSERVGRRLMSALELYSEKQDVKGAIAELEDTDPSDEFDKAYLNRFLGNLYAADDQFDKALELVKQAADTDSLGWGDHAAALKLTADLALQMEKYPTALEYYGKWLQFTGDADGDVLMRIANAHYELKQYDKIIQPADMAITAFQAKGEPNRNPYIMKIASYYEREMYPDAAKVLEAGLQVLPGEKVWWNQLGMIYMLMERNDKALQTLEIAYLGDYFDKENHYKALVQLYANAGIPFKAAMLMEKHIKAGDIEATPRNYQSAASNYEQARNYAKAAEIYALAASKSDKQDQKADYFRRQGTAFLRAEEYSKAADAYLKALDNNVEDPGQIYMSLAESHFYNNNFREALKYVLEAKKFSEQRRNASSWEQYIRQKASNRGVSL